MKSEAEQNFISLRRALKVCSLVLVVLAMLHTPRVIMSLGRAETLWVEMMGGADRPRFFNVFSFLAANSIFMVLFLLIVLIVCVVVTVKFRGGGFRYLNVGIFGILMGFNTLLVDAAQLLMRASIEAITGQ